MLVTKKKRGSGELLLIWTLLFVIMAVSGFFMFVFPLIRVWQQEQRGRAALAEAQYSKQIAVEEAKAGTLSAQEFAEAEVIRARGVAEANAIIADGLKGNSEYLQYLWIDGLKNGNAEVIYVPTEAGIPILEAGRIGSN